MGSPRCVSAIRPIEWADVGAPAHRPHSVPGVDRDVAMSRALELAVEARERGDHPFGAVLEVDGRIVAEAHNLVSTDRDITAHAELMLVRQLEARGELDLLAAGTVYASCEPCPMCVGALFWAGCRRIEFGLSHDRLNELARVPGGDVFGFGIGAADIASTANPAMTVDGPHREDEAAVAHAGFWQPGPG